MRVFSKMFTKYSKNSLLVMKNTKRAPTSFQKQTLLGNTQFLLYQLNR